MRKIAIIGLADTSHYRAPWGSPEWERWCLAWDGNAQDVDRYFEPHARELWPLYPWNPKPEEYHAMLCHLRAPIYMDQVHEDIPMSVPYPIDAVTDTLNLKALGSRQAAGDYFESSIGYMLALALHEAATLKDIARVGVWGVDMASGREYAHQRPNAEYLIARLHGLGVPVFIPPESALLKSAYTDGRYGLRQEVTKVA